MMLFATALALAVAAAAVRVTMRDRFLLDDVRTMTFDCSASCACARNCERPTPDTIRCARAGPAGDAPWNCSDAQSKFYHFAIEDASISCERADDAADGRGGGGAEFHALGSCKISYAVVERRLRVPQAALAFALFAAASASIVWIAAPPLRVARPLALALPPLASCAMMYAALAL
jgi:hypothetical protein